MYILIIDGVPVYTGTRAEVFKKAGEIYDDPANEGKTIKVKQDYEEKYND